jgi:hypothetical protein
MKSPLATLTQFSADFYFLMELSDWWVLYYPMHSQAIKGPTIILPWVILYDVKFIIIVSANIFLKLYKYEMCDKP